MSTLVTILLQRKSPQAFKIAVSRLYVRKLCQLSAVCAFSFFNLFRRGSAACGNARKSKANHTEYSVRRKLAAFYKKSHGQKQQRYYCGR